MSDRVPKIGDYGFAVVLTVVDEHGDAVNASSATTKQYVIQKPDGTVSTKTVDFEDDGADGVLTWTVTSGFIDQAGVYEIEAVVAGGDLGQRTSTRYTMRVGEVLG